MVSDLRAAATTVSFEGGGNDDGVSECDKKREDERQCWVRPTATRRRGLAGGRSREHEGET